jgi:hypothetical protein
VETGIVSVDGEKAVGEVNVSAMWAVGRSGSIGCGAVAGSWAATGTEHTARAAARLKNMREAKAMDVVCI